MAERRYCIYIFGIQLDSIEIRLDPASGNLLLRAEYRKGQRVGEWSAGERPER